MYGTQARGRSRTVCRGRGEYIQSIGFSRFLHVMQVCRAQANPVQVNEALNSMGIQIVALGLIVHPTASESMKQMPREEWELWRVHSKPI
jgi:hypothetical protein